jgi:hypothetical protein
MSNPFQALSSLAEKDKTTILAEQRLMSRVLQQAMQDSTASEALLVCPRILRQRLEFLVHVVCPLLQG